jgi:hypothetical protein
MNDLAIWRGIEARVCTPPMPSQLLKTKKGIDTMGVFACTLVKKGTVVGKYVGEVLTRKKMNARYPKRGSPAVYVLQLDDDVFVDCVDPLQSTRMRYVNSNHGLAVPPNVEFDDEGHVVAIRDIPKHTEFLVDYGDTYYFE